jgi:hypothetical protein
MKWNVIMLTTLLCAACANPGMGDQNDRAARNRCEALRSYQPYWPNECGELSTDMPVRRR